MLVRNYSPAFLGGWYSLLGMPAAKLIRIHDMLKLGHHNIVVNRELEEALNIFSKLDSYVAIVVPGRTFHGNKIETFQEGENHIARCKPWTITGMTQQEALAKLYSKLKELEDERH